MKHFVKHIFIFIFLFITSLILFEQITSLIIRANSEFKLESAPKYIVLGHSHSECAFNDSLINNFNNLSESGESYFYTFQKIKNVLQQNTTIKTVFIEYTNNHITESLNEWIWGESTSARYSKFSPFMSTKDKTFLMRKNFINFSNNFSVSARNRITQILKRDFNYSNQIGGYLHLVRYKTDSLLKVSKNYENFNKISNLNYQFSEYNKISEYNIRYLSKIIELCDKLKIKVILIRSPLHERYPGYKNESIYREVLRNHFKNIEFLDFSKFPLKNNEFGDLEHLNFKGAKIFSTWFQGFLNHGFLEEENKQVVIDQEINRIKAKTQNYIY